MPSIRVASGLLSLIGGQYRESSSRKPSLSPKVGYAELIWVNWVALKLTIHAHAAFRDQLLKFLETVPQDDFDGYVAALDKGGNTLEYRKYCDQLFEILITGGLLAPGGSYLDEDAPLSPFSIFGAKSTEVKDVKPYVDTIEKVIRRELSLGY